MPEDLNSFYKNIDTSLSYNEDIRPILADRCFVCHGPDANTRKAGLKVDLSEETYSTLESGNGKAIVPGNLKRSELMQRILSEDINYKLPPPESHMSVNPKEKAKLLKWIDPGAKYEEHWAFTKPQKSEVPILSDGQKAYNKINNYSGKTYPVKIERT